MTFAKRGALALVLSAFTLAACSAEPEEASDTQALVNQNDTLIAALSGDDDLSTLSKALERAQLTDLFDGPGSYTLIAPNDAAFETLGEAGQGLMEDEQRPVLIGLLRDHVIVGHLTGDDIRAAIADGDGSASMATAGQGNVTFALDGDALVVRNASGSEARIVGDTIEAGNGAALVADAVLVPAS